MSEKTAATTVSIQRPLDVTAWVAVRVGQPAAARGAAAAELMQILHLDEDCVAAAYLTPLPSDAATADLVNAAFGLEVGKLFAGVHRMASMQGLTKSSTAPTTPAQQAQQTEVLRKM